MTESGSGDGEVPTVEQPAPVRDAPTLVGPPGPVMPSDPPPRLPSAPGAPPRLPPVPMVVEGGIAPRTVVVIALLAALVGATLTAVAFVVLG